MAEQCGSATSSHHFQHPKRSKLQGDLTGAGCKAKPDTSPTPHPYNLPTRQACRDWRVPWKGPQNLTPRAWEEHHFRSCTNVFPDAGQWIPQSRSSPPGKGLSDSLKAQMEYKAEGELSPVLPPGQAAASPLPFSCPWTGTHSITRLLRLKHCYCLS